jgi:hypothetical protein
MFRRPTIQSVIRNASHVGDKPAIIFVFAIAEKFNQAMRLPQLRYLSVLGFCYVCADVFDTGWMLQSGVTDVEVIRLFERVAFGDLYGFRHVTHRWSPV